MEVEIEEPDIENWEDKGLWRLVREVRNGLGFCRKKLGSSSTWVESIGVGDILWSIVEVVKRIGLFNGKILK